MGNLRFAVAGIAFLAVFLRCPGEMPFWVENRIVYNGNLPHDRDGLAEGVDGFTDEFLSSVAGCGMNGVWMWVRWRDVAETSLTPQTAEGARRLAKLRTIARRCRAHGIGLWAFGIEPSSFKPGDALLAAHPELGGALFDSIKWRVWCPSEPQMLKYVEEAAHDLVAQVPELAGILNIANGESLSTCLDALWDSPAETWKEDTRCPRCASREPWRLYGEVSAAIVRGLRAAGPGYRYLSWFYQPTTWPARADWVADCAAHAPDGTTFVYNFESGVVKEEFGRLRCGGDYWLSQPGPGGPFRGIAAAAKSTGARIGAKIQTGNSHELATLPYVPAPGLLYRKYKAMHALGVKDVVQGWFFGGEPSLMLRAAGELSRCDFSMDERTFVRRFAEKVWGPEAAVPAAEAWTAFATAFSKYPVCTMMGYYGPFHTGVIWPLWVEVDPTGLPRSWKPDEPPAGDRIGECLRGYSLDEVETVAESMAKDVEELPSLDRLASAAPARRRLDVGVMRAFRLQVLAARNVFRFYRLRRDALEAVAAGACDRAAACVADMIGVVRDARRIAAEMLPLATADARLGFHAEAAARNYSPDSLKRQLDLLDETESRLRKIAVDVRAGGSWPVAAARRTAVPGVDQEGDGIRWRYAFSDAGDLVISGFCRRSNEGFAVTVDDLAGTTYPCVTEVSPRGVRPSSDFVTGTVRSAEGGFAFEIRDSAARWQRVSSRQPAWILFSAKAPDDCRAVVSLWPANAEPVKNRLAQPNVHPSRSGRLMADRGEVR